MSTLHNKAGFYVKNLLIHLSRTLPDFLHKWVGGGGEKIELRSATNVDLYNTKNPDTKLQHDCGSFYSGDGYNSDLGLLLKCVNTFQLWLEKKKLRHFTRKAMCIYNNIMV